MTTITVHTQAELDAALAREDLDKIIIDSPADVWITIDNDHGQDVWAVGSATVEAWGSATVEASGSATVRASGSATVRASGSATVQAWGSATVEAWDSATVEASGSVTVAAWDSATVRAWGSATVEAATYVAVHLLSARATVSGGVVINVAELNLCDAKTWCAYHGVEVDDHGLAHLYKAVDDDWTAGHLYVPTSYEPGSDPVCDNWRDDQYCGGGLHACPAPRQAKRHYRDATRFVEVTAPLDSIRPIDPTKCKAPSLHVLREVDIDGEPVQA